MRVKARAASLVDCSSNPSLPMKLFQLGVFMSELAMELIMTFSTASTVRKPNGLISQTMLGLDFYLNLLPRETRKSVTGSHPLPDT